MSIIVKNISRKYGDQFALNNVSFTINKREIAGFIGPNGAGKTTMMKIITGYLAPTSGEVMVNGLDVVEHSLEIRKIIGYLPEHNPLYKEMYIREYLKYVAKLYGLRNNVRNLINDIIKQTGLESEQKKKIGALSKGFRQRVGLAQCLIHNPEILILDEPTSGLDPNQIIEIRNLISMLGKEKTVLLSTHILQEVEAICTRVIIINNGIIVADEASAEIATKMGTGCQTMIVEFDKPVDPEKLKSLKGVEEVLNTDKNIWLIQTLSDKDIRSNIFELAVSEGIKVLSLQKQQKTLEEVFKTLTQS